MNSPLTYPDESRDDNVVELLLGLIGACLKKVLLELVRCFVEVLP
jgi:hypothetical protein